MEGKVTAVFNNSFDARLGNFLLNFNCRKNSLHPLGLLIDNQLLEKTNRDLPVKLKNNRLSLGNEKFEFNAEIETGANNKIRPGNRFPENINKLKDYLGVFGSETDFFSKEFNDDRETIVGKFKNFLNKSRAEASNFLQFFGRGPGLTPAFDDFFAGNLLIDRILGRNKIITSETFWQKLKEKTTLTSWWQLKFADTGVFNLRFEKFVSDLLTGKLTATRSLGCLRFGHSSGTDIGRGIYLYLSDIYL